MDKRKTYNMKIEILKLLENKSLSYTEIQTKLSTNYDSVKNNCKELEIFEFIEIKTIKKHPENGKIAYKINLTNNGYKILEKIRNQEDN